MRLPEFVTHISPVGETLAALETEQETLTRAVETKNQQCVVGTAGTEGLDLWEKDFGLNSEADLPARRAAVRAALSGGQTATPAHLAALCVTLGGADRGEVEEDFSHWAAKVSAVTEDRLPPDVQPLRQAVERLCPAHLQVAVEARGDLTPPPLEICVAPIGGVFAEFWM